MAGRPGCGFWVRAAVCRRAAARALAAADPRLPNSAACSRVQVEAVRGMAWSLGQACGRRQSGNLFIPHCPYQAPWGLTGLMECAKGVGMNESQSNLKVPSLFISAAQLNAPETYQNDN